MLTQINSPAANPLLDRERVRTWRHGVIEVSRGRPVIIRPLAMGRSASLLEIWLLGRRFHRRSTGDRCYLYYSQPRRSPNFLALKYLLSTHDCTPKMVRAALAALDRVAEIKGSDAIVCDVWNWRISDRLLAREGWQAHCSMRWHRNYIKRFYGDYSGVKRPDMATMESA